MYREYLEEVKKLLHGKDYTVVGKDVRRVDALEKVVGRAKYTADFAIENAFIVRPVRSPHAHALIKRIEGKAAEEVPGVVRVITGEDIGGRNECGYYIGDQPLITCDKARHVGDMVALVVARDEASAWAGADAVAVDYEVLPAVFDPQAALAGDYNIHEKKSPGDVKIRKGDVDKAFEQCEVVIERTYRAGSQDHAYLEPEAAIAIFSCLTSFLYNREVRPIPIISVIASKTALSG